jgi:hypothetical protein
MAPRLCLDCKQLPPTPDSRELCENCWAKRAKYWAWSHSKTRALPIHILGRASRRWSEGDYEPD